MYMYIYIYICIFFCKGVYFEKLIGLSRSYVVMRGRIKFFL